MIKYCNIKYQHQSVLSMIVLKVIMDNIELLNKIITLLSQFQFDKIQLIITIYNKYIVKLCIIIKIKNNNNGFTIM